MSDSNKALNACKTCEGCGRLDVEPDKLCQPREI